MNQKHLVNLFFYQTTKPWTKGYGPWALIEKYPSPSHPIVLFPQHFGPWVELDWVGLDLTQPIWSSGSNNVFFSQLNKMFFLQWLTQPFRFNTMDVGVWEFSVGSILGMKNTFGRSNCLSAMMKRAFSDIDKSRRWSCWWIGWIDHTCRRTERMESFFDWIVSN